MVDLVASDLELVIELTGIVVSACQLLASLSINTTAIHPRYLEVQGHDPFLSTAFSTGPVTRPSITSVPLE